MPVDALPTRTALVLIDLQKGITALPTAHSADAVVANSARLASAFRERGLPVVLVNVAFSADGGDALRARVDATPPAMRPAPDWAELREELRAAPNDVRITKRNWDAFVGTELDLQLRRRGVTGIVLGGISTSIGVESSARSAYALNYEVVLASDAMTDTNAAAHDNSLAAIFPRLGRIDTTDAILSVL